MYQKPNLKYRLYQLMKVLKDNRKFFCIKKLSYLIKQKYLTLETLIHVAKSFDNI